MNISSVILRTRPEQLPGVRRQLTAMPGVEVHAEDGAGRLVLTLEDGEGCSPPDVFLRLQGLDGVLSASLVYQYCDDELSQETEQ